MDHQEDIQRDDRTEEKEAVQDVQKDTPAKPEDRVESAIRKALKQQKEGVEEKLEPANLSKDEASEDQSEETETEDKKDGKTDQRKEAEPAKKKKSIAPRDFSEEEKKAFDEAPEALQKAFKRREKELGNSANKLNSELGALRKELERRSEARDGTWGEAEKEAKLLDHILKANGIESGVSTSQYIKSLVESDRQARKDPVRYLNEFASRNGVDLKALTSDDPSLAFDQETHQFASEIATLRAELAELRGRESSRIEAQKAQTVEHQKQVAANINATVQSLASEYIKDLTPTEYAIVDSASAQIFQQREAELGRHFTQDELVDAISGSYREAYEMLPRARVEKEQRQAEITQKKAVRASGYRVSPKSSTGGSREFESMSLEDRILANGRKLGLFS